MTQDPIERATIERLQQTLGGASTRELIGTFLIEAPKLLATIRAAVERDDPESLRRAAHTLKSNAATFGAVQLSELARRIERLAEEASTTGASELVAEAEREHERARRVLEAEREGSTS